VKSARWLDLDRRAMQKGRELFREHAEHKSVTAGVVCDAQ
jgi:hypothetical protein